MRSFLEALRFLTQIPVPWLPAINPDFDRTIARAIRWFPAVGLVVGLISAAAGAAAGIFWPNASLVRACAIVFAGAVVTAGLHLDGLSDTFDATMSWRSRERMLEIMKDSRIGAMGALALVAVIAFKLALLSAAGTHWWIAVIFACTLGRWVDAYGIIAFPAAKEGGLGKNFHDAVRKNDFWWATGSVLILAAVLSALSGAPGAMAVRLGLTMLLSLAGAHAFAAGWVRTLGGLTGDTYGALSELIEVIALAAMSAQAVV